MIRTKPRASVAFLLTASIQERFTIDRGTDSVRAFKQPRL
jgi:hypothetical protein